jgi:phosphatidylserine synthase 2
MAVVVYLLVCSWQLRDSLLVRPHPVFWRIIKGLSFLYCFGLVWLVFQNVGDARQVLSIWDPTLGVELEEKSYAATCAIYTPEDPLSNFRNIRDALIDEYGNFDTFIMCHVVGWFCKMIMIRDIKLTLVASVIFELYELSLSHMLPNFAECWWDTIILDIIVCNGFGIFVGYYW